MKDPQNKRGTRDSPLKIYLLGAFGLWGHGQEVHVLSRATRWLTALLVLHRKAPLSRDWLAETLWPETTQERSAFYLRRALTELRTALGSERHRLVAPSRAALHLDLADAWCDVLAFDTRVSYTDEAALEEALSLYRGPLLEECDTLWMRNERTVRAERFLRALETMAGYREQDNDLPNAIAYLRRVIEANPLRERAHQRLMAMLGKAGDYPGAERQYRELRRILHAQLHIEPSAETKALSQHCPGTFRQKSRSFQRLDGVMNSL